MKERKRESDKNNEKKIMSVCDRERVCVCVCACVRVRERE